MNEQPNGSQGQEPTQGTANSTAQNQTPDSTNQAPAAGEQNTNSSPTQSQEPAAPVASSEDLNAIEWWNKTHAGGKAELTPDNAVGVKQAKLALEREKLLSEKDKEISQLKTSSSPQVAVAPKAPDAPAQPQADTNAQQNAPVTALPPEVTKQLADITAAMGDITAGKKIDEFLSGNESAKPNIDKIAQIAKEETGGDLQNAFYIFQGRTGTGNTPPAAPTGGVGGVGTQSSSAATIATGTTMTKSEYLVKGRTMKPAEFNELDKQIAEGKVKIVD